MKSLSYLIIFIGTAFLIENLLFIKNCDAKIENLKSILEKPSVLIFCLIRNKAHTLPYFLTYLQEQDYPKIKISLWLMTDHNEDNSREIIETWLNHVEKLYHSVHYRYDDGEKLRSDETDKNSWSNKRFEGLINMKEEAFEYARNSSFDYLFFVDADVIMTNPSTLDKLINLNLPIVAPMLINEGFWYSNFWTGMTSDYNFEDTMEFPKIRMFETVGEFPVPMVYGAVLIDIRNNSSEYFTFNKTKLNSFYNEMKYNGPSDDITTFAISAQFSKTEMTITNSHHHGFILSPMENVDEKISMAHTNAEIANMYGKINILPFLQKFVSYPEKSRLTFDEIYMINLKRRSERRLQREAAFQELGIDCTFIEAVDGRDLTEEILVDKGIKIDIILTFGHVGCFLSHYKIWERMVKEQQQEVLIFEDDSKLHYNFNSKIVSVMEEARKLGGYDFIYIARWPRPDIIPKGSEEKFLPNTKNFVKPKSSFGMTAYVLTLKGAEKLLAAKPLQNLVAADNFLSMMYDSFENSEYMKRFEKRDLVAWSVVEQLASNSHYWHNINITADKSYVSDTTYSRLVNNEKLDSLYAAKKNEEL